jgi:hypothetical protein
MRRPSIGLACVLVAASLGVACGATAAPTREVARGASQRLLTYERSGGLAGSRATLTVTRDRRVVARPNGRRLTLGIREYRRLRADLAHADLARLPAHSRAEHPVPDGFSYVVVAGGHRVSAETGAVPARLAPLLKRLNGLLRRTGAG